MNEIDRLKRRLTKETSARKQAEKILKEKNIELYKLNNQLTEVNHSQEQKILERTTAIAKSEAKYRNFVENSSDIIYRINTDGYFTYANTKSIEFCGYSQEELLDLKFLELIPPNYRSKVNGFYLFQLQEKTASSYTEFPIITKTGEKLWIGQTADLDVEENDIGLNFVARDISDRKRIEKSLLLSEDKYRSIIENMELGLLETDRNGKVIKAYPKFCQMTGYSAQELIGKAASETLLSQENAEKMNLRNEERIQGKSSTYETKIRRKDGTDVWVLVSGAPYYNEKNQIVGSMGIHLDITHQKQTELKLRAATKTAEESLESKDLFLANVSHEIRTPLNAIIGITELLLDDENNSKTQKHLEIIDASSNNLLRLINDILDLSKIKSEKLEFHQAPVNLKKKLGQIYETYSIITKDKNIDFQLTEDIEDSQNYLLDITRFVEIIHNLVGNAIKFTTEGKVQFNIKKQLSLDDADYYSFEIIDTGIGIPKDDILRIFDNFEQASNNDKREYGGTGLGLSISKNIIEHMGGTLNLSSFEGKGTRFFFELKLIKCDEIIQRKKFINQDKTVFLGRRILLAEDIEVNQYLARTILEKWGCIITIANNGEEAIKLQSEQDFDLILMDVRMPIINGIEATEVIRLQGSDIAIIALTANATSAEIEKCLTSGMDGYLSKPYTQEQLFLAINESLASSKQEEIPSLIDLTQLRATTQNDKDFEQRMIELFAIETEQRLEDLTSALARGDLDQIQMIVHSMKPSIAHICKNEVFMVVREIELTPTLNNDSVARLISMLQIVLAEIR